MAHEFKAGDPAVITGTVFNVYTDGWADVQVGTTTWRFPIHLLQPGDTPPAANAHEQAILDAAHKWDPQKLAVGDGSIALFVAINEAKRGAAA